MSIHCQDTKRTRTDDGGIVQVTAAAREAGAIFAIVSDPDAPEATDAQLAKAKILCRSPSRVAESIRKNLDVRKSNNPKVAVIPIFAGTAPSVVRFSQLWRSTNLLPHVCWSSVPF
ncbi:hypothetical protein [Rhizobium leguminosarum]|jgi:hypothetical protein|uniref:hypothetical protein n=1 Tax=Rhizobium leguminosarum TaxID=384 RepID=UPI003F9D1B48